MAAKMTAREWREYRDLRAADQPAKDAKAATRATTALRKAADSCLKINPPKPEWSNPTLLSDEFAAFERERLGA